MGRGKQVCEADVLPSRASAGHADGKVERRQVVGAVQAQGACQGMHDLKAHCPVRNWHLERALVLSNEASPPS